MTLTGTSCTASQGAWYSSCRCSREASFLSNSRWSNGLNKHHPHVFRTFGVCCQWLLSAVQKSSPSPTCSRCNSLSSASAETYNDATAGDRGILCTLPRIVLSRVKQLLCVGAFRIWLRQAGTLSKESEPAYASRQWSRYEIALWGRKWLFLWSEGHVAGTIFLHLPNGRRRLWIGGRSFIPSMPHAGNIGHCGTMSKESGLAGWTKLETPVPCQQQAQQSNCVS